MTYTEIPYASTSFIMHGVDHIVVEQRDTSPKGGITTLVLVDGDGTPLATIKAFGPKAPTIEYVGGDQ